MEAWRSTWRNGIAPELSADALLALQMALQNDDRRLLQECTTSPPPLQCVEDLPCKGACALGYAGWQGKRLETVAEVETYFARACFAADQRLGELSACRWFINWYDNTPRGEMIAALLPEVDLALAGRVKEVA